MNEKAKTRFMKIIVWFCIGAVIGFAAASYIAAWWGVDTVPVLQVIAWCLGGELMLTAALKLMGEKYEAKKNEKAAAAAAKKTMVG